MPDNRRSYFLLHFVVFTWGWTAILGKVITLNTSKLVWIRMMIAIGGILTYLLITRQPLRPSPKNMLKYLGVGLIVAAHWMCFYGSVKASNASVAAVCFSTISLFTAFIEPFFFKRKISLYEIVFGAMAVLALFFIFRVQSNFSNGIVLGIFGALTSALFGVINGMWMRNGHNGTHISLYEMIGGMLGMTVLVLVFRPFTGSLFLMSEHDFWFMLLFGIVCTTMPFLISMRVLKTISPYTVALTLNLETIYTIIFAYFIFHENKDLSTGFYLGTGIILATVFLNAYLKSRKNSA